MSPDALNNLFSLLIGFAVAGALTDGGARVLPFTIETQGVRLTQED